MRNPQSASKCLLFYKLPLLDLFLSRFSEGNCERQLIAAGGGSSICVALGTVSGCKGNREGSKTSLIPKVLPESLEWGGNKQISGFFFAFAKQRRAVGQHGPGRTELGALLVLPSTCPWAWAILSVKQPQRDH